MSIICGVSDESDELFPTVSGTSFTENQRYHHTSFLAHLILRNFHELKTTLEKIEICGIFFSARKYTVEVKNIVAIN
jgi:hypothetical protein